MITAAGPWTVSKINLVCVVPWLARLTARVFSPILIPLRAVQKIPITINTEKCKTHSLWSFLFLYLSPDQSLAWDQNQYSKRLIPKEKMDTEIINRDQ